MKQFEILSGRCLVVELPEGAIHAHINPQQTRLWWKYEKDTGGLSFKWRDLPPGNWRIIGMLSEVTEEQAAELVETHGLDMSVFKHYGDRNDFCETALESLDSAIVSAGYHLDFNPYGNESRVLCRSRCLLLGREDG